MFFFFGNVRQFISNSNSSNTKYFYDWPISNSSNTPISNYFLTVRTKEEFTVGMMRGMVPVGVHTIKFDLEVAKIVLHVDSKCQQFHYLKTTCHDRQYT